jgi:hypothetical protein
MHLSYATQNGLCYRCNPQGWIDFDFSDKRGSEYDSVRLHSLQARISAAVKNVNFDFSGKNRTISEMLSGGDVDA